MGICVFPQVVWLRRHYHIVMWDVVTRDYSPHMTPNGVFNVVKNYTRNGSVIVFHDSLKAERNMREAMPRAVEWLLKKKATSLKFLNNGYLPVYKR